MSTNLPQSWQSFTSVIVTGRASPEATQGMEIERPNILSSYVALVEPQSLCIMEGDGYNFQR